MGKKRGVHETTPELRNRMVGMFEAGLGLREIAAAVNCSQRTVKRWLNRFNKEGTVETRDRCGRKRATTSEQDEAIVRLATGTSLTAAKAVLPVLGLTCSVDTVRERLHKAGIHNWSPSRKYIQRIPLGNNSDSSIIQQAVWRPTGTHLVKKKLNKETNKEKNSNSIINKKKNPPRKVRARDLYVGDGAPAETIATQSQSQQEFTFTQPDIQQSQTNQMQLTDPLSLDQQPQSQPIYEHAGMNIEQNWPLALVQDGPHFTQNQPHQILDVQQLTSQQKIQNEMQRNTCHREAEQSLLQHHSSSKLSSPLTNSSIPHESCSNSNSSSDSSHIVIIESDDESNRDKNDYNEDNTARRKSSKKGGKAKGTLETSVELRNRMIGMSEAGLSTLSIALAIDRSERTVKRWLERWHKEGNVQTKERKGRRRITTKEQDEAIVAMATQQPLTAAKFVAPALGLKCSVDTIRERLHKAGIHSWKLGKKPGENNAAVHMVHLWQPSGNRHSKTKISGRKKKESGSRKKNALKKTLRKKVDEPEEDPLKLISSSENPVSEEQQFHNVDPWPNMMQSTSAVPVAIVQAQSSSTTESLSGPNQPLQPIVQMMLPRPDCRLAPSGIPTVSTTGNSSVSYPSCMVGNNNHTSHMEQTDPLNYEPYIWSF